MANSQTYIEGLGGASQITTLSQVQGAGLKLPVPTADFINIRSPGKIERLFTAQGNSNVLYTTNKPPDLYLKGPLATANFEYRSIEQGQRNKLTTPFKASRRDARRITKFLGSSAGTKFILKQLVLQGFQPHDETKVYNPASPIIAALRLASFATLDRPTRHLDTSNIVGGLLGGTGLGSIVNTIGRLAGKGPPVPAPPRSSVASGASSGFGLATFTSMLGGADKSDKVVSPLARPDVRDLLRGQTATNAYNSTRYSKLVGGGGGSFFGRLLSGVGKFLQNNTLIGGIIPPKQPWAANYRADEETYDLYLNAGKLFNPDQTGIGGGGILSGILKAVGFGKKADYSQAVRQRFYNKSKNSPNFNRSIVVSRINRSVSTVESTDETAYKSIDQGSQILPYQVATTRKVSGRDSGLKYTDLINVKNNGNLEQSDQLLNYKVLTTQSKNFSDTFSDPQSQTAKDIAENYSKAIINILGQNNQNYKPASQFGRVDDILPQQFHSINIASKEFYTDASIGFDKMANRKYLNRFENSFRQPTITGRSNSERFIEPTNGVDYVNSLDVLKKEQFEELYKNQGNGFGPDIVSFYFYDIVNQKYIPFAATVKGIQDSNSAEWETVEYLGRPDKQYYYKGFTREVSFNFTVNAHSIKELMPMWQRINYLVGLTRPANYTEQANGGFMIPPMVQLTLGDFYKNHFVVIRSCNITIPEDASWETLPEKWYLKYNWHWGPNRSAGGLGAFEWQNSFGKYAQFPRTVEINMNMSILEKDRPKVGRAIWGDAIVSNENGADIYGTYNKNTGDITFNLEDNFSTHVRYDTDIAAFADEIEKIERRAAEARAVALAKSPTIVSDLAALDGADEPLITF
jgi:hypothetical protein